MPRSTGVRDLEVQVTQRIDDDICRSPVAWAGIPAPGPHRPRVTRPCKSRNLPLSSRVAVMMVKGEPGTYTYDDTAYRPHDDDRSQSGMTRAQPHLLTGGYTLQSEK
jgi:hypothetical protein